MTARPMKETCRKLREAIENGHLRCSVSVGVGSPVATIDTEDLWRLVHAAERSLSTSAAVRGMREALTDLTNAAEQTLLVRQMVRRRQFDDTPARIGAQTDAAAWLEKATKEARAAISGTEGEK